MRRFHSYGPVDCSEHFCLDAEWCAYLYMNGIIDFEKATNAVGGTAAICGFSCPFVQHRIYNALTINLLGEHTPIPALDPLDDLSDVFEGASLRYIQRAAGSSESNRGHSLLPG